MPNWFFGLQFRLILGFGLILALAMSGVSGYIGYTAQREVDRLQAQFDDARDGRVQWTLSQFYAANGGWAGLQPVIERAGFLSDREIVVVDENDEVVGDTRRRRGGSGDHGLPRSYFHPIMVSDKQVGSVRVAPTEDRASGGSTFRGPSAFAPPDIREQFEEPQLVRFAAAINRALVWAGLAAAASGVLLVSLVSSRALGPVRTLTAAARALGSGDMSRRVADPGRDEVGELARTFNSMADGLEDAERQRRNMVADVAHELRTPLSNIQGYVEAIRDGLLAPDAATLNTVHQQASYLSSLVEDLRTLAETEARGFKLDLQTGSIDETLRAAVEAFRPRARNGGVSLDVDLPDDLPLVEIDRTRIEQVVGNLIENAIRHTPSGGAVTVTAAAEDGGGVRVAIADTGEGIPAEALPFVFERFHRVDPSRSRATGGAGLGLTIARQLVGAHGGSIHAESTPSGGSRFVFTIPGHTQQS